MDNNSLARTKWECKYHLVFVCPRLEKRLERKGRGAICVQMK